MKYEDEKALEKAQAQRLQRQGLPLGEPRKTTEADVDNARQQHIDKTYANGLDKNRS